MVGSIDRRAVVSFNNDCATRFATYAPVFLAHKSSQPSYVYGCLFRGFGAGVGCMYLTPGARGPRIFSQ